MACINQIKSEMKTVVKPAVNSIRKDLRGSDCGHLLALRIPRTGIFSHEYNLVAVDQIFCGYACGGWLR
jgi:hypothetical protein